MLNHYTTRPQWHSEANFGVAYNSTFSCPTLSAMMARIAAEAGLHYEEHRLWIHQAR